MGRTAGSVRREELVAVALLTVLAGALRFTDLDLQSFWFDEALTETVIRPGLGDTLDEVRAREATPPLYYALLWLWAQVFGEGDVALRSFSALLGTAAVPVTWLAARELVSGRAALIAAALVATAPYLIWYSQEARSYALASLLAALSLLFLARAARDGRRRDLALWGVGCALLFATHYFAAFLIAAEAAWLVKSQGLRRDTLLAMAAPALSALLLAPLAFDQREDGRADWIDNFPLGGRVSETLRKFVSGFAGAPGEGLGLAAAVLIVAGAGLLVVRVRGDERRGALLMLGLAGVAAGAALLLSGVGFDYLYHRNLLVLWIPLAIALGAGFASARTAGTVAAGALCLVFAAIHVAVVRDESYHRPNWEAALREIGQPRVARGLVLTPAYSDDPLIHYGHRIVESSDNPPAVRELALIGEFPHPGRIAPGKRFGKFTVVRRQEFNGVWAAILRSPRPEPLKLVYIKGTPIGGTTARILLEPAAD